MFCPECGLEVPNDAKFCGKCRHQFSPQHQSGQKELKDVEVSPQLKWGVIAASFFLPVGWVMGAIYFFQDSSKEKKEVGKLWLIFTTVLWVIYALANDGSY